MVLNGNAERKSPEAEASELLDDAVLHVGADIQKAIPQLAYPVGMGTAPSNQDAVKLARAIVKRFRGAVLAAVQHEACAAPVNMLLWCPQCQAQHVDAPEASTNWTNPPHRSHLCHVCGCIWRPADVPTNGVRAINTIGQGDTWRGSARPTGKAA